MTGKERILAAIECREVDRTPWVPFVGVHGGKLLDVPADDYLRSVEHVVAGINKAVERYKPDGVPVVFDLQIEAEVFGCELNWTKDCPPAVITHPLEQGMALTDIPIPGPGDGRVPQAIEATRKLRATHPELAIYGLITGPFTLALHLLGTNIFMEMFDAPKKVRELLAFCSEVGKRMSEYYIDAGADVVAVVDPMTSQIGPEQFRDFVTAPATAVFEHIRSRGAKGSFFVCGHAEQNLHVMCDCKPDNVSVDENIPLQTIRDICLERGVSFGGNLQLTSVLLLGKPIDAQRNALECLEIGGQNGFILAPGCDLPYDTPAENLVAVAELVHDEYQREVIKAQAVEEAPDDLLDMSQYGQSDKVVVDIITLDSEACAPCQYMVESVRQIAPEFEGIVLWREHKIKRRESLVFMTSLMVRNIPTICIDGKITFVSRIPGRDELIQAIHERILDKMKMRISQAHGEILILCDPEHCDEVQCQSIRADVERAAVELGAADLPVRTVTDRKQILSHGVLPTQTPAVVTSKYRVRSTGEAPEHLVLREWIKDVLR
jgi:uroporphyrinogen decarboxylase